MLRLAVIVILAMLAATLTGCTSHASCPAPAHLTNGTYSSYRTAGTMPDGASVRLSDGDTYSCANGIVSVR
jgi:hypothetical protein